MQWSLYIFAFIFISVRATPPFPFTGDEEEKSGRRQPSKIVGGEYCEKDEFPFICGLYYNNQLCCGASILNEKTVLTADHCVDGYENFPSRFSVGCGMWDYKNPGQTQFIPVSEIYEHPQFSSKTLDYDAAILKLAKPIQWRDDEYKTCPIEICPSYIGEGETATVIGWGTTYSGSSSMSNILQKVEVNTVSNTECAKNYPQEQITATMLCGSDVGKDACQGDSGGPLVVKNVATGEWCLAGIVSWGYGCASPGYPGVYGRTSAFSDWIQGLSN